VITSIDGEEIEDFQDLAELMKNTEPGKEVDVLFLRDGKKQNQKLTLSESDHSYQRAKVVIRKDLNELETEMEELEYRLDQLHQYFHNDGPSIPDFDSNKAFLGVTNKEGSEGVVIESVIENSAAEEAGLKGGHKILKIDGEGIDNFSGLIETLESRKAGDKVEIEIEREVKKENIQATLKSRQDTYKNGTEDVKIYKIRMRISDADESDIEDLIKKAGMELKSSNQLEFEEFRLSPNPGSGEFDLSFSTESKGAIDVQLFSPQGQLLYENRVVEFDGSYEDKIDIRDASNGVYFLIVKQGEDVSVKKLVKD